MHRLAAPGTRPYLPCCVPRGTAKPRWKLMRHPPPLPPAHRCCSRPAPRPFSPSRLADLSASAPPNSGGEVLTRRISVPKPPHRSRLAQWNVGRVRLVSNPCSALPVRKAHTERLQPARRCYALSKATHLRAKAPRRRRRERRRAPPPRFTQRASAFLSNRFGPNEQSRRHQKTSSAPCRSTTRGPRTRNSNLRFRAALRHVERDVPSPMNVFASEVVHSEEVSRQDNGSGTNRRRTVFRILACMADFRFCFSCQRIQTAGGRLAAHAHTGAGTALAWEAKKRASLGFELNRHCCFRCGLSVPVKVARFAIRGTVDSSDAITGWMRRSTLRSVLPAYPAEPFASSP